MRFFAIASVLFAAAPGAFSNPVAERQAPQSAAVILTDLCNTVTPLANYLLYATPANATQDNLMPIIGGINTAVTSAVTSLNGLSGKPTSVIFASVDGTTTLTVSEIASLLASTVNLIFMAIGAVLAVVDSTIYDIIYDLCNTLGQVVSSLISIILALVPGLLVPLLSLLGPVLSIIISLVGGL